MWTTLKRLASSVLNAPAGKVRVFVDDTGVLTLKDEAGVATAVGTGASAGAVPLEVTEPDTTAEEGKIYAVDNGEGSLNLFYKQPDNGAIIQVTNEEVVAQLGLPLSAEITYAGNSTELVPGFLNQYEGSISAGYFTELILPASPEVNQEFWMLRLSVDGQAALLGNGNFVEQGLDAYEDVTLQGTQILHGVKWNGNRWRFISTAEVWWSTQIGEGSITVLKAGMINRFRNDVATQTLRLPLEPRRAMEVWIKEISLTGGFATTIEAMGGAQVETTIGTFVSSFSLPGADNGYSLMYKYDSDESQWRLMCYFESRSEP